jgi:repressor LexA
MRWRVFAAHRHDWGCSNLASAKEQKKELLMKYIEQYMKEHHYSPTIRECCEGIGVRSTSSVHAYLSELRACGKLEFLDAKPRTMRITDQ